MYLVHARLRAPRPLSPPAPGFCLLPTETGRWAMSLAVPTDGVEHVAVHPRALPHPVLGLYLLADRLEAAEESARVLVARTLAAHPELSGWKLLGAQAPLVAPFYESLLDGSAPAGRNRPGPLQSS